MKYFLILFFWWLFLLFGLRPTFSATTKYPILDQQGIKPGDSIPEHVRKLMKFYPQIKTYRDNLIYFRDGSSIVYDDGKNKNRDAMLNQADVEDQFYYRYKRGYIPVEIPKNEDPGRIRDESFFKKIYGSSEVEVRNNLVEVVWCPKLVNQTIKVTKINGVDQLIKKISAELDEMPEMKKYIKNIGGTFNWRKISGTNRLSTHSFGTTIDINTEFSDYWQWTCHCKDENNDVRYRNRIPQKIVDVFEKYGFIWGGKWYHFDTMHFEYRPELVD
jgi:hypothetical protein